MSTNARSLARSYFENLSLWEDELPFPKRQPVEPSPSTALPGSVSPLPRSLDEFHRQICDCTRCPLGHTRTRFVFGDGNPHARIVFVGEAPGHDEDLQGIPFVGRAGQLLNQLLAGVGLDRRHVYICNVLKCRPPNNRDPEAVEVSTCKPYLLTQLSLIRPAILVCLGRHAVSTLVGVDSPMKDLRGRIIPWQGLRVLVTYHPAYYLRSGSQMYLGEQDFRLLRQLYDECEAES